MADTNKTLHDPSKPRLKENVRTEEKTCLDKVSPRSGEVTAEITSLFVDLRDTLRSCERGPRFGPTHSLALLVDEDVVIRVGTVGP